MILKSISRPITPIDEFENALSKADLTEVEILIIEHIRLVGAFNQPSVRKALDLASKPPVLSILCHACRQIGSLMPDHFEAIRDWSKQISEDQIRWDGALICSATWNIDGIKLCPEFGTSLYHNFCVHRELFNGL